MGPLTKLFNRMFPREGNHENEESENVHLHEIERGTKIPLRPEIVRCKECMLVEGCAYSGIRNQDDL